MTTVLANIKRQIIEKEAGKNGKIFTVKFIKKDGTKRVMTCRLGVKKHLVGTGPSTTAHIDKYLVAYDVNVPEDRSYRNINLETVYAIKGAGKTITFE